MFNRIFFLLIFLFVAQLTLAQEGIVSFLALGDSYTAATSEKVENGWPYQLVGALAKSKVEVSSPKIIAGAGWTTTKLLEEIETIKENKTYGLVGLMIGVNNQFRGLSIQEFEKDFENLLKSALIFANNKPEKVFVVSIPNWSVTPFARFKDKDKISRELNTFNESILKIAEKYEVLYIDVTKSSRNMGVQTSLIASDSLHPSARMYKQWGKIIAKKLKKQL